MEHGFQGCDPVRYLPFEQADSCMTVFHLTLVSHGLTGPQRTGRFHLEEDGLLAPAQVRPVADLTQSCLSAPERRALQTTERLGLLGEVDNALRDCDLGQWAGKSLKTLQRESPAELAAWLSDAEAAPMAANRLHGCASAWGIGWTVSTGPGVGWRSLIRW